MVVEDERENTCLSLRSSAFVLDRNSKWLGLLHRPARHGSLPAPIMYSSKLEGSPGKALPFKIRLEQGLQIPSGNLPGGYTGHIRRDSKKQFSACARVRARTPHLTSSVSSQFFEYNPRPSGKIFSPKSDALQESGCRSVWDTAPEGQSSHSVWQAS